VSALDNAWTPSTEQVRSHYVFNQSDTWDPERGEAFDRWLAAHDAALIAEHEGVLAERAAPQAEPSVVAAALSHIESEDYYIAKPHKAHRDLEAVRQTLLDAAAPPEWEYGVALFGDVTDVEHGFGHPWSKETQARSFLHEQFGDVIVRRHPAIPATPWEPLPEDTDQTEGENQ
jgi:hypothetical protein